MTRRKQNYPKRLKCSPTEENASQQLTESGGDNSSPLASDNEEDDGEEDTTGDDEQTESSLTQASTLSPPPQSDTSLKQFEKTDEPRSGSPSLTSTDDKSPVTVSLSNANLFTMTIPPCLDNEFKTTEKTTISAENKTDLINPAAITDKKEEINHTEVTAVEEAESPSRMTSVIIPMELFAKKSLSTPDKEKAKVDHMSPQPASFSQQLPSHKCLNHSLFGQTAAPIRTKALSFSQQLPSDKSLNHSLFGQTTTPSGTKARDEQPLDLSTKSSRPLSGNESDFLTPPRKVLSSYVGDMGGSLLNGKSSLESLQLRFGGSFPLESAHRPSSIIPLQSTVLPNKPVLRPPPSASNGFSSMTSSGVNSGSHPHHHHHHHHSSSTHHSHHQSLATATKPKPFPVNKTDRLDRLLSLASSSNNSTTSNATTTTAKRTDKPQDCNEVSRKSDPCAGAKVRNGNSSSGTVGSTSSANNGESESKYTIHRCSCQKSFGTLYSLSAHLQETGHIPGSTKQASLMDYPKLVRGQDMWLNQESEQTRRILRCMQCGESFKSLPMLTVHMMQTQHYSKIVSADHGRRSHKCSAYCDREVDRECIFKCKVCQDTYSDMEGLANHMIVSGHHKKQVLRSHNFSDLGIRHKQRKRFLSDDALGTTVASLLEYKRKYQGGSGGSNGYLSQVGHPGTAGLPASIDNFINCENCGKKIEMHNFVEHVRACLRQKAEVIDALKNRLSIDESVCSKRLETTSGIDSKLQGKHLPSTKDSLLFRNVDLSTKCTLERSVLPKKENNSYGPHSDCSNVDKCMQEPVVIDPKTKLSRDVAEVHNKIKDEVLVQQLELDSKKCLDSCSTEIDIHAKSPHLTDGEDLFSDRKAQISLPFTANGVENVKEETVKDKFKAEKFKDITAPSNESKNVNISHRNSASPSTDEDNTSERTPSPHSHFSQSDDSKLSSPSLTPPPHFLKPRSLEPVQQSIKREIENDWEPEMDTNKKIKLEVDEDREGERTIPLMNLSPPLFPSKSKVEANISQNSHSLEKTLDIIDPNSSLESQTESGSSALKAMESFIQRSFSSKFDARRNSLSPMFNLVSTTTHLQPLLAMSKASSASFLTSSNPLSKFSRFLPTFQTSPSKYLDASIDMPLPPYEKSVLSSLSAKSAEILEKSKSLYRDSPPKPMLTPHDSLCLKNKVENHMDRLVAVGGSTSKPDTKVDSCEGSGGGHGNNISDGDNEEIKQRLMTDDESEDKEENLVSKYLNPDIDNDESASPGKNSEACDAKVSGTSTSNTGKLSALDSLSSFVYGQPMTSEHPLDSLQKLLTKTDIPRMMAAVFPDSATSHSHFGLHHQYLPEHMMDRLCFTPPDLRPKSSSSTPLNLSLKSGGGYSGSEEEDQADFPQDCESPSTSRDGDDENCSSPGAQVGDGEMSEYKCAACSRRFASKGSYRYHLSRCHLSSVKKYGIKEAFNMSPYVYLPLDHTAKFTKYYQMAQELANKSK